MGIKRIIIIEFFIQCVTFSESHFLSLIILFYISEEGSCYDLEVQAILLPEFLQWRYYWCEPHSLGSNYALI